MIFASGSENLRRLSHATGPTKARYRRQATKLRKKRRLPEQRCDVTNSGALRWLNRSIMRYSVARFQRHRDERRAAENHIDAHKKAKRPDERSR